MKSNDVTRAAQKAKRLKERALYAPIPKHIHFAKPVKDPPCTESWWTAYATPGSDRAAFVQAAASRDALMGPYWSWSAQAKVNEL